MKRIFLTLLTFAMLSSVSAQSKLSSYTQSYLTSKQIAKTAEERADVAIKYNIRSVEAVEYVSAFIHIEKGTDTSFLTELGVIINVNYGEILSTRIPTTIIEAVSEYDEVAFIEIGAPVKARMQKARASGNVESVHSGTDLDMPYLGTGVVVGVLDTGFEYAHNNFYTSDGTELRVKRVWNQNSSSYLGSPENYSYGAEYATEEKIIAAAQDNTSEYHATHVTGIAAGSNETLGLKGVAPDADIVMVSMDLYDYSTEYVSLSDGIKYMYDYADSVGQPCVVNMSLGTHVGPHDGTSTFDRVCDLMQGEGKLLVGAAGNEGDYPLHLGYTFSEEQDTVVRALVQFYSGYGACIDIWGDANTPYEVQLVMYDTKNDSIVASSSVFDPSVETKSTFYPQVGGGGYAMITGTQDSYNNKYNAMVTSYMNTSNNYALGLIITAKEGTVHAWADGYYCEFYSNTNKEGWTDGDTNSTMGEVGGTGKRIITTGAYTSSSTFTNYAGNTYSVGGIDGYIAYFSSLGPTPDGRMKPDISAPGHTVISSYNTAAVSSQDDYLVYIDEVDGQEYYYGACSGTSMSTPFVTGVLATWLQTNPKLTPEDVREILSKTATNDKYTGSILALGGDNTFGYGKINAWEGIKEVIATSPTGIAMNEVSAQGVVVKQPTSSDQSAEALFTLTDSNVTLRIYNTNGALVMTQPLGAVAVGETVSVDVATLASGVYIMQVAGTTINNTTKMVVK